jgi:hypothetical protein
MKTFPAIIVALALGGVAHAQQPTQPGRGPMGAGRMMGMHQEMIELMQRMGGLMKQMADMMRQMAEMTHQMGDMASMGGG